MSCDMRFGSMEKSEKLYVKIAKEIIQSIQNGTFKAGDKLPSEREIASQLEVSRPSVREALAVLEITGVVKVKMGDGIYVVDDSGEFQINPELVNKTKPYELMEARAYIETTIVKLAIERATDEDIQEIQDTNDQLKSLLDDDEKIDRFFVYGIEFHKKLAKSTHNEVLEQIANQLLEYDKNHLWQHLNQIALQNYQTRLHQLEEHESILHAIKKRDIDKAEELMRSHLDHLKGKFYE